MTAFPVLGSTIGQIFQPLFEAMAWLISVFYSVVPNYAIAIAVLTVVVMVVTSPLTVKSTRSMVAMQRVAPELKKIQQKYKGDRQTLNEEMMKLYKEHNVSPAGGCLPMLIQFPVFIVLYDVIKGLTNTVKKGQINAETGRKCQTALCAVPRYIGHSTKLYSNLVASPGKMEAFGLNLASKALGQHSIVSAIPYVALILVAIGLQYFQMRQLNSRNPQYAQSNPQVQMMQRYMPLIMAVIYINIAAGVNVYFIVSNLSRIGIQEIVFRTGLANAKPAGDGPRRKTVMQRLADAQQRALETQQMNQARQSGIDAEIKRLPELRAGEGRSEGTNGTTPSRRPAGTNGTGSKPSSSNGKKSSSPSPAAKKIEPQHPRAKDKRDRKAR